MPGQGGRLAGDPLLEVSVGGDHERPVIDDLVAGPVEARREHPLGERHPHGVGDPLSERTRGHLDAGKIAVFGVARSHRSELAEPLEVVLEADVVAGQVQGRVQKHRRVPARQDEAVAVRPLRMTRAVAHDPRVQNVGHRRQRHWRPGMTGVRLLHAVHRERADRVDAQPVQLGGGIGRGHRRSITRSSARKETSSEFTRTGRRSARTPRRARGEPGDGVGEPHHLDLGRVQRGHHSPGPSCAASIAASPSLVASTRSNAVGVPPRWTCPSTVARVSNPVRSSISRSSA